jgi:PIN domain nuclease of toxin-antitoxin system
MILLDTHVLIWLQDEPRRLSRPAESAIRRSRGTHEIAVSVASLVETAGLLRSGRIQSLGSIETSLSRLINDITVLPLDLEVAALTAYFPSDFPNDPMDRIIAATARAEGIPLVTADQRMLDCPLLKTIW